MSVFLIKPRLVATGNSLGLLKRPISVSAVSSARTRPAAVKLHYERTDVAEPKRPGALVILHGLFGSKQNWRSLSKSFARTLGMPVYALDMRNHGTSPHAEPMNYHSMATDVLHFFEEKGLSDISLLGHSMGGKVAMSVALDPHLPPDILRTLIVEDISPKRGSLSKEFQGYVKAMREIESKNLTTRKEADEHLNTYEPDLSTRQFLLTNLLAVPPKSPQRFRVPLHIIDKAIHDMGDFPYEPGERQWHGPTLFIKGTHSPYIKDSGIELARKHFPNLRTLELPTGHWVHAQKPNEFVQHVSDFIRDPSALP